MTTAGAGDELVRWAVDAAAPGGVLREIETLREPSGPWMLRIDRAGDIVEVVLKLRPGDWRTEVECEVAALRFTEQHGLPTPRLLATDLEGTTGAIGFVCTALDGEGAIPAVPSMERLLSTGAAAAEIHKVTIDGSAELPRRTRQMPWVDFSEQRRAGRSPTTTLLDRVDARLAATSPTTTETVLVHGDLWQGNLLFEGDSCVGIVDWEAAGAGDPGIDVGSLRWDAAILFGPSAADDLLAGWEAASGRPASDVAYWDLVAAANTPADLSEMVDSIAQQGRPDLDGRTLTARRDAFLESALDRLGQ